MQSVRALLTLGALTAAVALVATEPLLARDPASRVKARKGFELIQEALEDGSPKDVQWVIPTDAVIGVMDSLEKVREWRSEVAESLRGVKLQEAREAGDDAAARYVSHTGDAVMEVLLRYGDGRWYVSGAGTYEVDGRALAATRGRKPARVEQPTRGRRWRERRATMNPGLRSGGRIDVTSIHRWRAER